MLLETTTDEGLGVRFQNMWYESIGEMKVLK